MAPFVNVSDVSHSSAPSSSDVVFFSSYERKGVIVMAVAGLVSCSLVSILLLYIIVSAFLFWRQQNPQRSSPFIRKQVAVFVICLLVSDLIQGISGVLQVKWATENRIYDGPACTAQAATMLMGDLGSTVWSCVIAAHTFSGLALGRKWSRTMVYMTVVVGWSFVVTLTVIGPTALETSENGPFFGIAGDWCFITSHHAIHRLVIHYVPLFVAAIIIMVFYGLVFLVLRGSITFLPGGISMRLDDVFLRERVTIAKRMLWYPIAYLTCIFPIAITRLVGLRGTTIPDSVWVFGMTFLFLLGAIDSVIYATTRNLVKPLTFATHMRTLSSDVTSTARTGSNFNNSPRKSGFSDIDRVEIHRALDMTQYSRWDRERTIKLEDPPQENSEARPGVTAIHVTLERIQEVM